MSHRTVHTTATRAALRPGAEYGVELEFDRLTIPPDLSRNLVTRLLVDRAERGGWELDRLRLLSDGTRKVVLRRKIIRQRRPELVSG